MTTKTLTGDDAFAELERLEAAQEPQPQEVPDTQEDTQQDDEIVLPVGYELREDLRQGHLLDFIETQQKDKGRFVTFVGEAQATIEAAVSAGWFTTPSLFVQAAEDSKMMPDAIEQIRKLKWEEIYALSITISRRYTEAISIKKK